MLIWPGINFPIAEFLLFLSLVFSGAIIYFGYHLHKLEKLTSEEKNELAELEKIAQEEKEEIKEIENFEAMEKQDLEKLEIGIGEITAFETKEKEDFDKFEREMEELEVDAETLYLKKLVPDVYRIQNYVLWALKKGLSPKEIKENLAQKGWKDSKLIEMIIDDMAKYVTYYRKEKGNVALPIINIHEKTHIIKPIKYVKEKKEENDKIKDEKEKKKKKEKKKNKKKKSSLKSVDKKLKKLEEEIEKDEKEIEKKEKKSKKKSKKKPKKKSKKKTKKKK
ncbi:hypothetical protein GF327_00225 [Candidatus Woesearchaeota archaeon]|nr:hypothetical protein [Candidatus Woesearchaeota archaeon]